MENNFNVKDIVVAENNLIGEVMQVQDGKITMVKWLNLKPHQIPNSLIDYCTFRPATIAEKQSVNNPLLEFATQLKANGFKVYIPDNPNHPIITYCHFVKDDKIGYVEYGWGFSFNTVHKPNSKCGTGFSVHREVFNPTVSMAEDCFIFAPGWASGDDRKAIIKYQNWAEYAKLNNWQAYKEL